MNHHFELPVKYKGEELNLIGRLTTVGYIYKFYIVIHGEQVVFEKDDDGKYRVLLEGNASGKLIDHELMEAVIAVLDSLSEA